MRKIYCPKCDYPIRIIKITFSNLHSYYYVECKNCGYRTNDVYNSLDKCINAIKLKDNKVIL